MGNALVIPHQNAAKQLDFLQKSPNLPLVHSPCVKGIFEAVSLKEAASVFLESLAVVKPVPLQRLDLSFVNYGERSFQQIVSVSLTEDDHGP